MVGGKGELIPAPSGIPFHGGDIALTGVGGGILDGVSGLVGEFAEIDLQWMGETASMPMLAPAQKTLSGSRSLPPRPPDARNGDAEPRRPARCPHQVVRVELHLVALVEPRRRIHIHVEEGHRPVEAETPMAVAAGIGLKSITARS